MLLAQDLPLPTETINALLAADAEKLIALVIVLIAIVILVVSITGLTVIKNAGKADARADALLQQMLDQNGKLASAIDRLQTALSDDNRNHEQVANTLSETAKTLAGTQEAVAKMQKSVTDHQVAVAETVALLDTDVRSMTEVMNKKLDKLLKDLEEAKALIEEMPDDHEEMKNMLVRLLALTERLKTDEVPMVAPDGKT